jgi:hypothetical protein
MLNPYGSYFTSPESTPLERQIARQSQAVQRARELYRSARFAGQVSRLMAWLSRRPDHLLEAAQVQRGHTSASHYAGLQPVPIGRIVASEGRSSDFDAAFNPLQEGNGDRWTKIATLKLLGYDLPPVELIQVGEDYIVRDGHHRISVAAAMGQESIDAHVTVLEGYAGLGAGRAVSRLELQASAAVRG